jgi:transposase
MAMGRNSSPRQSSLWVERSALPQGAGHPFYERLNSMLEEHGFDAYVEGACSRFYADTMGRPSLPPGVYFRMLLVGYFERLDSERGIAWRCQDSLGLRTFLGCGIDGEPADHSTISRTRRLIDLETHQQVFQWVLAVLAKEGLLKGKTIGIDGTTLEANAALRSIVRRDTGESYQAFLRGLAKESGIETPTREDLARLDRKRSKKGSNDEWKNPHDPDAQITKMKDGRTHLSHKDEHAVDMETGAVVAVTVHGGAVHDTVTLPLTLAEADGNLAAVQEATQAQAPLNEKLIEEVVADKGYHCNRTMVVLKSEGVRSYVSEPDRGPRRWKDQEDAQVAVYGNRRRIRGHRGRALLRRRGEVLERAFTHYLDSGGMRRTHLRGNQNILKRLLIHVAGFNLGLVMRTLVGRGTPKELSAALFRLLSALLRLLANPIAVSTGSSPVPRGVPRRFTVNMTSSVWEPCGATFSAITTYATGC